MKYTLIVIPAAVVLLAIGYWLVSGRGDDGAMIRPSVNRSAAGSGASASGTVNEYDYTEAPDHIGERATIIGTVVRTFTAKSGVTFFDFCQSFDDCPFSAVIFASDLEKFGDLTRYERAVKITGVIRSYQGKAEVALNDPDQIE